jgi:hypothetical protein
VHALFRLRARYNGYVRCGALYIDQDQVENIDRAATKTFGSSGREPNLSPLVSQPSVISEFEETRSKVLKSTNLLFAAGAALVASATALSAMSGASAKSYSLAVFQGSVSNGSDCTKVSAVTRNVSTKPTPMIAVVELVKGPNASEKKKGLSSVFSSSTAGMVQRVRILKGTAYVNFNSKASTTLNNAGTSCGRDQFFTQMEKTLGQFSGVKTVLFAIDSRPADFYSLLELECPEALGSSCSAKDF